MADITFQYPAWFFIFCLLLGGIYSFILYYRTKTFETASVSSRRLLYGLSFLRFAVVSFIAFLLLAPLLRSTFEEEEEPIVIMVQDNSASIAATWSDEDSASYMENLNGIRDQLEKVYRVKLYSFGGEINEGSDFEFNEKSTDISQVFDELYNLYTNQNLGAIILASDGIYNEGTNPLYARTKLNAPVFSLALGDTVPKKDLKLQDVYHNRIAYQGDKFEVILHASAQNSIGESSVVTIDHILPEGVDKEVFRDNFTIDDPEYNKKWSVILDADETGLQHYRVQLSALKDEVTLDNNYRDFFVDVLDSRQKVLLLAHAPHPDLSAIRQTLETNKNYDVDLLIYPETSQNPDAYNLIILHQLPSNKYVVQNILGVIKENNIPVWFILGKQSSVTHFNEAQKMLHITRKPGSFNEAQGVLRQEFSVFKSPEGLESTLRNFPPLFTPYGDYNLSANSSVMLKQKIGAVTTEYPLLLFSQTSDTKQAVLTGEGIWRWRLYDYLHHNSHEIFNDLVSKSVQFLATKADKRKFRVTMPDNIIGENQPVLFNAELYNDNYELVNDPEVSMSIINEEGKEFTFNFSKSGNAYRLNAGFFEVGTYSFTAVTTFNSQNYSYSGQFSVTPVKLESMQTTANHRLLYQLSQHSGGELIYPAEMEKIPSIISQQEHIRPVIHETEETKAFINLRWMFFLILALLAVEWFVRKYNGAY